MHFTLKHQVHKCQKNEAGSGGEDASADACVSPLGGFLLK